MAAVIDFVLDRAVSDPSEQADVNKRPFSTLDDMKVSGMLKLIADQIFVPITANSTWAIKAGDKELGRIVRDDVCNFTIEVAGDDVTVAEIGTQELTAVEL